MFVDCCCRVLLVVCCLMLVGRYLLHVVYFL